MLCFIWSCNYRISVILVRLRHSKLFTENICMWILRLFSRLCFLLYLFMSLLFELSVVQLRGGGSQVISFSMLHYVSLVAHCGGEEENKKKGGIWLRGEVKPSLWGDADAHGCWGRGGGARRKGGSGETWLAVNATKSYFHQFTEVEINMTVAYLFQWLYFWVISRQMKKMGTSLE